MQMREWFMILLVVGIASSVKIISSVARLKEFMHNMTVCHNDSKINNVRQMSVNVNLRKAVDDDIVNKLHDQRRSFNIRPIHYVTEPFSMPNRELSNASPLSKYYLRGSYYQ